MSTEIIAHAYSWDEQDKVTEIEGLRILAWCLDRDSNPYLLRFEDFFPFCYIELPRLIDGHPYRWTQESAQEVMNHLKFILKDDGHEPVSWAFGGLPKIYYYTKTNDLTAFIRVYFKNIESLKKCEMKLKYPRRILKIGERIQLNICEGTVLGISMVRKMLSLRKSKFLNSKGEETTVEVKYSGWFSVKAVPVSKHQKISKLSREYIVSWQTMLPIDSMICKSWVSHPGVLAFDIETYSDNHKALPDRDNSKHVVYMLSAIYQKFGMPETRKRYKILLGECDDIENVKIIKSSNETDFCTKFSELVEELDPELLTGYNIFGYDYPYLHSRLMRYELEWNSAGSRLLNVKPFFKDMTWQSSGYGYNSINIINFPGRISVDLLPVIKRDFKLPKYDLNTVGKHFLNRGKHDVSAQDMFRIYEGNVFTTSLYSSCISSFDKQGNPIYHPNIDSNLIDQVKSMYLGSKSEMSKVGRYCIEDSELVLDLFEKLICWIGLVEMSNVVQVPIMDVFTKGQQVRGVSQIYNLSSNLPQPVVLNQQTSEKILWHGGYVGKPQKGVSDLVECFDFKSLYPSIMIAYNICLSTLVRPEDYSKVPIEHCNVFEWTEGETDKSEESENELHPEEIIQDRFDSDDNENTFGNNLNSSELKKALNTTQTHHIRFIKSEHKRGILPILVENLIKSRREVQAQMRNETDTLTLDILDKRQWALKISANSVFGMLGVQNGGKLPLVQAAMCVTYKGRELIQYCNKYLEEKHGAIVVYNDTDSTMVTFPFLNNGYEKIIGTDSEIARNIEAIKFGDEIAKELSSLFPDPLELEFEKIGRMLTICPKKYAFWQIDMEREIRDITDPTKKRKIPNVNFGKLRDPEKDKGSILFKGMILARRDNCLWQREFYHKVLMQGLRRKPMYETLKIIVEEVSKLYYNKIPWEQLTIIRSLGANYKSESYFMKIFGDELRILGKPASPGDRLEYLIVRPYGVEGKQPLLGYKMRLPETYLERLNSSTPEPIDTQYYLEKVIMNCIDQIWGVDYFSDLTRTEYDYKLSDLNDVLMELVNKGYSDWVNYAFFMVQDEIVKLPDKEREIIWRQKAIEWLKKSNDSPIKTKATQAKSKYISGKSVFNTRISLSPIKKLVKALSKSTEKFEQLLEFYSNPFSI